MEVISFFLGHQEGLNSPMLTGLQTILPLEVHTNSIDKNGTSPKGYPLNITYPNCVRKEFGYLQK